MSGFSFKPKHLSWSPCTIYSAYCRQSAVILYFFSATGRTLWHGSSIDTLNDLKISTCGFELPPSARLSERSRSPRVDEVELEVVLVGIVAVWGVASGGLDMMDAVEDWSPGVDSVVLATEPPDSGGSPASPPRMPRLRSGMMVEAFDQPEAFEFQVEVPWSSVLCLDRAV